MTILWQPTANTLAGQASSFALAGQLLGPLQAAGAAYDAGANDSPFNVSPYAVSWQKWWNTSGAPAWSELDRQCLYAFRVAGKTATPQQKAAFGIDTVASAIAWQPTTTYAGGALVAPVPANGFYFYCTTPGTTGSSPPAWPTIPGELVSDGSVVWICLTPILPELNGQPQPLPLDETLQTSSALFVRASSAQAFGAANGVAGLPVNIASARALLTNALAGRPVNTGTDAASNALVNALVAALSAGQAWLAAYGIGVTQ